MSTRHPDTDWINVYMTSILNVPIRAGRYLLRTAPYFIELSYAVFFSFSYLFIFDFLRSWLRLFKAPLPSRQQQQIN